MMAPSRVTGYFRRMSVERVETETVVNEAR